MRLVSLYYSTLWSPRKNYNHRFSFLRLLSENSIVTGTVLLFLRPTSLEQPVLSVFYCVMGVQFGLNFSRGCPPVSMFIVTISVWLYSLSLRAINCLLATKSITIRLLYFLGAIISFFSIGLTFLTMPTFYRVISPGFWHSKKLPCPHLSWTISALS